MTDDTIDFIRNEKEKHNFNNNFLIPYNYYKFIMISYHVLQRIKLK